MRTHRFLVIYRRENDPELGVWKTIIEDTTKKAALQKFYQTITNGSFNRVMYRVIEIVHLVEPVKYRPAHNYWKKEFPSRPKCQTYVCPYCSERCYATSYGCDYTYCPHCGREVIMHETIDRL